MILFFLLASHNAAFSAETKGITKEYSPESLLSFTRYLIEHKEYYRAIVELRRLESFYPGLVPPDTLYITELYLLFGGRRYQDVQRRLYNGNSRIARSGDMIFKADSFFEESEYGSALRTLSALEDSEIDAGMRYYFIKRLFLANLLLNRAGEAGALIGGGNIEPGRYRDMMQRFSERYSSQKNPYAALFAGVIPGMGYVYSGNRATGVFACIAVTLLSTLTYFAFKTGNEQIGIFIGAAATFFYTGSILGGFMETGRFNRVIMEQARNELVDDLALQADREDIFKRYGLR